MSPAPSLHIVHSSETKIINNRALFQNVKLYNSELLFAKQTSYLRISFSFEFAFWAKFSQSDTAMRMCDYHFRMEWCNSTGFEATRCHVGVWQKAHIWVRDMTPIWREGHFGRSEPFWEIIGGNDWGNLKKRDIGFSKFYSYKISTLSSLTIFK